MKAKSSVRNSTSKPEKFRCDLAGVAANSDLEWREEPSSSRRRAGGSRAGRVASCHRAALEESFVPSFPASGEGFIRPIIFTSHARRRAAQRALGPESVEVAVLYGREWQQRGGFTVHFIGDREVTAAARCGIDLRDFRGVTVILSRDHFVITLYRSRTAPVRQGRLG